jgi:hypothetical protein
MKPLTYAEIDRLWALTKRLLGAITRNEFDAAIHDKATRQPLSFEITALRVEIITADAMLSILRARLG